MLQTNFLPMLILKHINCNLCGSNRESRRRRRDSHVSMMIIYGSFSRNILGYSWKRGNWDEILSSHILTNAATTIPTKSLQRASISRKLGSTSSRSSTPCRVMHVPPTTVAKNRNTPPHRQMGRQPIQKGGLVKGSKLFFSRSALRVLEVQIQVTFHNIYH